MEGLRLNIRAGILAAATVVLSFVMAARLYDLQIVNGDSYYGQSEKKITRSVYVEANRGELLDRYGRKLVTNRLSYNISFDWQIMPAERRNEIILNMIRLCKEKGLAYTNTMPISYNGKDYGFTGEKDSVEQKRFAKYLKALGWPEDLTAGEVIAKQCTEYEVDPALSAEDALSVCGIRYELDLRSARIGMNIPSYIFTEDVSTDFIGVVKERDLPGVSVDTVSVRSYETPYAAHLLGRVGPIYEEEYAALKKDGYAMDDYVGKDGAEKAFEKWLRGVSGTRIEELNTSGKVTNIMYTDKPEAGDNVLLTLDVRLQEAAERALASRIQEIKKLGEEGSKLGSADVGGGAAVVLDVRTGEVLAMASYPTYNLSSFNQDYSALIKDELRPMYNRALMGTYEPGSTFKMVTASAALNTGVIDGKTEILDRGLYTYFSPTYTPACEIYLNTRGTHGYVNVVDALKVSCNYFFFEVGRLTGIDKLNEYARRFGFGEKTGIELEGESSGTLAGPENRKANDGIWYPADTIQAAIGQSDNLFTPLQLANYVSTLVNGGKRNKVHILKSVKSYDYSQTLFENKAEILGTADLNDETVSLIKQGMLAVSERGSASAVFGNYPIKVGSKTGTAQTGRGSANGIFVAFAPYDNPEIAVALIVERAGKGSRIGVIARDIFDAYFRTNDALEAVVSENKLIN
jgi:penicillin-binding protein 2